MLRFTDDALGQMKSERVSKYHERLKLWLSARDVDWDDLSEAEQDVFLTENDGVARRYKINSEKARGLLAYALLLSSDRDAFQAREDVAEVLGDERTHEYGKVRRLHAIAYDIAHGAEPTEATLIDSNLSSAETSEGATDGGR